MDIVVIGFFLLADAILKGIGLYILAGVIAVPLFAGLCSRMGGGAFYPVAKKVFVWTVIAAVVALVIMVLYASGRGLK